MPASIKRNFVFFSFLIFHVLGNPQPPEDGILASSFPLDHAPVAPFDSHLTASDKTIDGNWDNGNEAGLQTNTDPPIDNAETLLIADEGVHCVEPTQKPSKLRRSRLDKRQKSFCPLQEFRGPTSPTPPEEGKQGASSPTSVDQSWPRLRKETSVYRLLIQLERAPGTNGESNSNVCEGTAGRTIPVCFPFHITYPLVLGSPASLVEPCRFCEWFLPPKIQPIPHQLDESNFYPEYITDGPDSSSPPVGSRTDVCIESYEELWCCVAAKKRLTEHLEISPSDFEVSKSWCRQVAKWGWLLRLTYATVRPTI